MTQTEAQRKANLKYYAKNYTFIGCKLRKEEAEAFKKACKEAGTTPNALFLKTVREFLATKHPGDPQ